MKNAIKFALLGLSMALVACDRDGDGEMEGNISVGMTDAPGAFQEVNIDLVGVEVLHAGNNSVSGGTWTSLNAQAGIYDLLKLQNGVRKTIVPSQKMKSGRVNEIRLILGTRNTVKLGGLVYDMDIPVSQQSALQVRVNETIKEDESAYILLDFDAGASVLLDAEGNYHLHPVIKVLE